MTTTTAVNARILELVEKGYESGQIVDILREEQEARELAKDEGPATSTEEDFPDAIRIISQALATRKATPSDIDEVYALLKEAYDCESSGDEAFLHESSPPTVSKEAIEHLISDSAFTFLVMEIPNGLNIEKDGLIIGASCYSRDGESKRDGKIEGKLASVRYMGVLRRYQHLCVGRRLLSKVESEAIKDGCVRIMICIASSRERLMGWVEDRGYFHGANLPYPQSLGHTLRDPDTHLCAFLKELVVVDSPKEVYGDPTKAHLPPQWRGPAN